MASTRVAASLAAPSPTNPTAHEPGNVQGGGLWKWIIVCQTACLFFASALFVMRTYVRAYLKRVWILEDYMCCCSFALLVAFCSVITVSSYKGAGKHERDLTTPQVTQLLYYFNLAQIIYGPAAATIKTTILLLFLRIISPRRWGKLDMFIRAFLLIICVFYGALTIAKINQCIPRAQIWDKSIPGSCISIVILLDVSGVFNIVSDFIVLLIPLKDIRSVHTSRTWKPAIYLVFMVGTIAPVFSIIGFVERWKLGASADQPYNQVIIYLWVTAELAVGVLVICFPTLPSISNWRTKKARARTVNGTTRIPNARAHLLLGERGMNTQNTVEEEESIELGEARLEQLHAQMSSNAVLTEISGGPDVRGSKSSAGLDGFTPSTSITKMVGKEQSKG